MESISDERRRQNLLAWIQQIMSACRRKTNTAGKTGLRKICGHIIVGQIAGSRNMQYKPIKLYYSLINGLWFLMADINVILRHKMVDTGFSVLKSRNSEVSECFLQNLVF